MKYSVLFIMCIIIVSGCSPRTEKQQSAVSGNSKPVYGGTVVEGVLRDAICLNPIIHKDSASDNVVSLIFNGLVKYDKNYNIVGDLAENWEVSEDGKIVTFHLKHDVFWHDGHRFTAEDVKVYC